MTKNKAEMILIKLCTILFIVACAYAIYCYRQWQQYPKNADVTFAQYNYAAAR